MAKLGADVIQLAALPNPPSTQQALTDFGAELQTVAGQFQDLAKDFAQLGDATQNAPGAVGQALMVLMQDFHALGVEVAKVGVEANALIDESHGHAHGSSALVLAGGQH